MVARSSRPNKRGATLIGGGQRPDAHDIRAEIATLYSRNWAFIPPDVQAALENTVIFAAGVGLSSVVAQTACRTGFRRFLLADGDTVELSNLNRQAFTRDHLGVNKAVATARLLRAIRPDAQVETLPRFLDMETYAAPLARADLVISSLDYNSPALFALNRAAQAAGKPVLIGLNLGWGGAVMVFTPRSPSLEEFLGVEATDDLKPNDVAGRFLQRVFEAAPGGVPPYLAATFADYFAHGDTWPCEPQLGVAAQLTAAMLVRAAVALVAGEPVRVVPRISYCDLRMALEPPESPHAVEQTSEQVSVARGSGETGSVEHSDSQGRGEAEPEAEAASAAMSDYEQELRARQGRARYPSLVADAGVEREDVLLRALRHSGLVVTALRHGGLNAAQRAALGEFRLHQYALAGLYDMATLAVRELTSDPAMDELTPADVHIVVATDDAQVLAYACLQSASDPQQVSYVDNATGATGTTDVTDATDATDALTFERSERPLFPCERELFGPAIFASLPALRGAPLVSARELTRVLRNQLVRSPLGAIAVVEVIHAVTRLMRQPELGLRFVVGCAGPDARRLQTDLKMPILYAPQARVRVVQTAPADDYWIPPSNADGVFWPFVVATEDLTQALPFLRQLDAALDMPREQVRRALVTLLRASATVMPRSLLPAEQARQAQTTVQTWVADACECVGDTVQGSTAEHQMPS